VVDEPIDHRGGGMSSPKIRAALVEELGIEPGRALRELRPCPPSLRTASYGFTGGRPFV
jgi:hypothetical protein